MHVAQHAINTGRTHFWRKTGSLIGSIGLVVAAAAVIAPTAASADTGGSGGGLSYDDVCLDNSNPLIYVGGDFTTKGYNEVGSPFVINGNATFGDELNGSSNGVGAAAGGGQFPDAGEVVLRVGGTFTGTADARGEGSNKANVKARIGGEQDSATITTAKDVKWGLGHDDALGPFANWEADSAVQVAANYYLNTPVTSGDFSSSGSNLSFTGTSGETQQRFKIPASTFDGETKALKFTDVGSADVVIVEVAGDNPDINVNYIGVDGSRVDYGSALAAYAKKLVWVFPDASTVTFSGGSQFVGSIIAPKANVTIKMSTGGLNGRLWVGKNLNFNPSGTGWEIHDYSVPETDCPTNPTPPDQSNPPEPEPEVVAPGVTFKDQCGIDHDTYTLAARSGATYVDNSGNTFDEGTALSASGTVTVTATLDDGYKWSSTIPETWEKSDANYTWTHTFTNEECDTTPPEDTPVTPTPDGPTSVKPAQLTVDDAQCTTEDAGQTVWQTVDAPDDTDGISYSDVTVNDDHVATVTAKPADHSYSIDLNNLPDGWTNDNGVATWTKQLESNDCTQTPPEDTPATPTPDGPTSVTPAFETQCIAEGDSYELDVTPAEVGGIRYKVENNGTDEVTVTAEALDGYKLRVPDGWSENGDVVTTVITPDSDGLLCVSSDSKTETPTPTQSSTTPETTPSGADALTPTAESSSSAGITVLGESSTEPSNSASDQIGAQQDLSYTGIDVAGMLTLALLLAGGGIALTVGAGLRRTKRQH